MRHLRGVAVTRWGHAIADDFFSKQLPHNVTWGLTLLYAIDRSGDFEQVTLLRAVPRMVTNCIGRLGQSLLEGLLLPRIPYKPSWTCRSTTFQVAQATKAACCTPTKSQLISHCGIYRSTLRWSTLKEISFMANSLDPSR